MVTLGSEVVSGDRRVTVIAGGVGAAKFLRGLLYFHPNDSVTALVNVADDFHLHGLAISPDLDTVTYTLGGLVNPETGWGRAEETWRVRQELERLGGETWFNLGDLDLALHLYRTQRLSNGATLTEVTKEISTKLGIEARLLPASDQQIRTQLKVQDQGWVDFQNYFVAQQHDVAIEALRFEGIEQALPGPEVITSLREADIIIIAPSNPFVSVMPVLEITGISETVKERKDDVIAVSPIVGGAALKGPASRMLQELGFESSVVGIASLYRELAGALVIDHLDSGLSSKVESEGLRPVITDTIMSDPKRAAALAKAVLEEI
jgi:LPPG:FO 2-phospho-L-lactate transferase